MARASILVVEDEFIVAFELKTTLEGIGYEVCGVARSGEEAVDLAERHRPDLVLMDVSLKGKIDGIEAGRRIHQQLGVRTAFMSGYPADDVISRAKGACPVECFVKPLKYDRILAFLDQLFEAKPEAIQ